MLARQRAAAAVSARDENVDNDTDGRASAAEELRSERSAKLRLAEARAAQLNARLGDGAGHWCDLVARHIVCWGRFGAPPSSSPSTWKPGFGGGAILFFVQIQCLPFLKVFFTLVMPL